MTDDRLEKVRAEVERLMNELIQEKKKGFGSDADDACILELQNVLTYIDSLQEEPKPKFRKGNKVFYLNEEYVVEDITDHYILRSTRERTSVPVVHIGFGNEDYELRLVEEPVSEELEEVSKEWLRPQLDKSYANYGETKMMELTHFDGYAMLEAIEFGAKWQKEQFGKNRLEHCNSITNEQAELEQKFLDEHLDKNDRMPTFLDAIEYGMGLQKEQMMKDAITIPFSTSLPNEIYNPLWINGAEIGDKIKLIIIKED